MILTKIGLNGDGTKHMAYFNLKLKTSYTFSHDEFKEVSTEVPIPFNRDIVEPLIMEYLKAIYEDIKSLERVPSPTVEQKAELNRFKQQLDYLSNYEY